MRFILPSRTFQCCGFAGDSAPFLQYQFSSAASSHRRRSPISIKKSLGQSIIARFLRDLYGSICIRRD
ncbi:hypothetical protein VNO77_27635 [Canavalia gladiata]|uniref:Uncharacterized protein n=1 Tax=Canavalia gladiata TaxID=3824 RepID=A0AAN9KZ79_CANGL